MMIKTIAASLSGSTNNKNNMILELQTIIWMMSRRNLWDLSTLIIRLITTWTCHLWEEATILSKFWKSMNKDLFLVLFRKGQAWIPIMKKKKRKKITTFHTSHSHKIKSTMIAMMMKLHTWLKFLPYKTKYILTKKKVTPRKDS